MKTCHPLYTETCQARLGSQLRLDPFRIECCDARLCTSKTAGIRKWSNTQRQTRNVQRSGQSRHYIRIYYKVIAIILNDIYIYIRPIFAWKKTPLLSFTFTCALFSVILRSCWQRRQHTHSRLLLLYTFICIHPSPVYRCTACCMHFDFEKTNDVSKQVRFLTKQHVFLLVSNVFVYFWKHNIDAEQQTTNCFKQMWSFDLGSRPDPIGGRSDVRS